MNTKQRKEYILSERTKGVTLDKIGKVLGITKQRVSQIEKGIPSDPWRFKETDKARKYWIKKLIGLITPLNVKGMIIPIGLNNITQATKIKAGSRDRLREFVRMRDKHTCQKCGKVWMPGTRRFDVHHLEIQMESVRDINYDRNNLDKMITLCHKCHLNLPHNLAKMRK